MKHNVFSGFSSPFFGKKYLFLISSLIWSTKVIFSPHIFNSSPGEYCVQSQNAICAMFLQSIAGVQHLASALSQ